MNVSLYEAGQERPSAPVNHIVKSDVKARGRRGLDSRDAPSINRYAALEDAISVIERDDYGVFDEQGHRIWGSPTVREGVDSMSTPSLTVGLHHRFNMLGGFASLVIL